METTFLDRLKIEKNELIEKVFKLSSFVKSPKIEALSTANSVLLKQQLEAMNSYLNILIIRIELLEK